MRLDCLLQDLGRRTELALERNLALEREVASRLADPPRVGDVFLFVETREHSLAWVVISGSKEGGCFLLVPADTNPLLGSGDVAVAAAEPCGPLGLRSRFAVWLATDRIDLGLRIGSVPRQHANRAYESYLALDIGRPLGGELELEVDDDPEYLEWLTLLASAREALCLARVEGSRTTDRKSASG